MPYITSTALQQTYKTGVITINGRFRSLGAAAGDQTLITANGASEGVKSVRFGGNGVYTITFNKEVGIAQYLGAASFIFKSNQAPVASGARWARVLIENLATPDTDPSISFAVQNDTGGYSSIPLNQEMYFQIYVSTNNAF